jgi:Zn-dependent protease
MRLIARILFAITWVGVTGAISETLRLSGFLGIAASFLLALPLILVVIVVHELGHAWAVRRLGGKVTSFTIVGLDFVGASRQPVDPRLTGREIGGHVEYYFDGGETRREHAFIAAAGPGANLLLALVAGLLALAWMWAEPRVAPATATTTTLASTPRDGAPRRGLNIPSDDEIRAWLEANPRWEHRGKGLPNLFAALALLSAGIALANLMPFSGSDGEALKDSLRPSWRR